MTTTKKLNSMPYAQATVINNEGVLTLVSYTTPVIIYDTNTGWFECTGLYSMTTRKHIGAFMREYTNADYHFVKELVNHNLKFNMQTGEVVSL